MKTIFVQIVRFVLFPLICLVSLLPLPILYGISYAFVVLPMKWGGYRRAVILDNLAGAFPETTEKERFDIAKQFYRYLGRVVAESVWLFTASCKRMLKRFSVEGAHVLEDLKKEGRSVVVMIPHIGNWEFLKTCSCPQYETFCGYPQNRLHMVYQRVNSPVFEAVMHRMRSRHKTGWRILESKQLARYMDAHKNIPSVYAMVADQCPGPAGKSIAATFLGRPTLMIAGPEYLAGKHGFAVVYGAVKEESRGKYTLCFRLITKDAKAEDSGVVTETFARLLEADIRQNVHLWLWSHRRWKRIPSDEARNL